MNPSTINTALGAIVLVAVVVVNCVSFYLFCRLSNLVVEKIGPGKNLVNDRVAGLYTKYLFGQLMAGKFYPGTTMKAIGNPENDRIIRAVKASDQYQQLSGIAFWLRDLPVNIIPYWV